jgi:hypothetical protein
MNAFNITVNMHENNQVSLKLRLHVFENSDLNDNLHVCIIEYIKMWHNDSSLAHYFHSYSIVYIYITIPLQCTLISYQLGC